MEQNQCVFEYGNFGNGYLKIVVPKGVNNLNSSEIFIDLRDYQIENGVITKIDDIIVRIKEEIQKLGISSLSKIILLLRCCDTYHTVLTLPVKNRLQAKFLYNKAIKTRVNHDKFQPVNNYYNYGAGYIFNTYCISKEVISSFSKIAKRLGAEISHVKPFGMSLCDSLSHKGNYVYFYIMKKTCTMIFVSDMNLVTSYDFEFENSKTIMNMFLLVASKYEFEYNYQPITHYGISSDEEIELNLGLSKL